jgi:hypothetical protein
VEVAAEEQRCEIGQVSARVVDLLPLIDKVRSARPVWAASHRPAPPYADSGMTTAPTAVTGIG